MPVAQTLYSGYSLFFLLDNATNHFFYAKNVFQIKGRSNGPSGKQTILRNGGFVQESLKMTYSMTFHNKKSKITQKEVQKVCEESAVWPTKRLQPSYSKSKSSTARILRSVRFV